MMPSSEGHGGPFTGLCVHVGLLALAYLLVASIMKLTAPAVCCGVLPSVLQLPALVYLLAVVSVASDLCGPVVSAREVAVAVAGLVGAVVT